MKYSEIASTAVCTDQMKSSADKSNSWHTKSKTEFTQMVHTRTASVVFLILQGECKLLIIVFHPSNIKKISVCKYETHKY